MTKPLAIDLYCGLGGWTEGLLAEGYTVCGFDIEQHVYGEDRYPGHLCIQDVRTLHGSQFKGAALIVASPPCQEYSYMAMPWTRAKQIATGLRGQGDFPVGYKGSRTVAQLRALFDACFRIQREASEAAGHPIPLVVENVKGAQPWVGKAQWNFGSYYLWGDVPALMPLTFRGVKAGDRSKGGKWSSSFANTLDGVMRSGDASEGHKNPGFRFDGSGRSFQSESVDRHTKNTGGSWFNIGSPGQTVVNQNPVHDGAKGADGGWFNDNKRKGTGSPTGRLSQSGSKSSARKAASARIAKIPAALAQHIARVYYPSTASRLGVAV